MTCIVAIKTGKEITLAGDRLIVRGNSQQLTETKLFTVGDFTFGFCGNLRLAQAVKYGWRQPDKVESTEEVNYLINTCIPSLKQLLVACDFGDRKALYDIGVIGLIVYKSTIYRLSWDFSLQEVEEFDAVGCGDTFAKGFYHGCSGELVVDDFLPRLFKACSKEDPFVSEEFTKITFNL